MKSISPSLNSDAANTPMMKQFLAVKARYPKHILFFRMGDFYEMFLDDAIWASKVLDIALTRRQDKIPMCGIPYHSMKNYVHPILAKGRMIAVAEQIEDPKAVSGRIVKRDVVRILTPGTIYEEDLVEKGERNLLASVFAEKNGTYWISLADVSTGEIWLEKSGLEELNGTMLSRGVVEIVSLREQGVEPQRGIIHIERGYPISAAQETNEFLGKFFGIRNLQALEINLQQRKSLAILFFYLNETSPNADLRFSLKEDANTMEYLFLDESAQKTLEIFKDQSGSTRGSLFHVLNETGTSAGARLLRDWLQKPLCDKEVIQKRYNVIDFLLSSTTLCLELQNKLESVQDIERTLQNLANSAQVRHLGAIQLTLAAIENIREMFSKYELPQLLHEEWSQEFPSVISQELKNALVQEDLPPVLDERRFLKEGYSTVLDEFISLSQSAASVIAEYEAKEKEKHGIANLKVRYNKIVGYYIEISKGQLNKVPKTYIRKQTLVNSERFSSPELLELEEKILSAKENVLRIQTGIFQNLCSRVLENSLALKKWAYSVAGLDVLISFAKVAEKNRYIRPSLNTKNQEIKIISGRHPVVESLFKEEIFVPNDVHINSSNRHLLLITGPNMAGKSTYIRQVGLLQLMAQAGSFIPAQEAHIPIVDRIFTRIGAYDRLYKGESTFFVEMAECARIFQKFTANSLILLDEVGRGTSTFDGISIARAMIEHLNTSPQGRPKTLFATHYSELAELIDKKRGIVGMTVQVTECEGSIIFLRKITEGVASRSYGIHVAEMAGLPLAVVSRAKELLQELETEGLWSKQNTQSKKEKPSDQEGGQSFLF